MKPEARGQENDTGATSSVGVDAAGGGLTRERSPDAWSSPLRPVTHFARYRFLELDGPWARDGYSLGAIPPSSYFVAGFRSRSVPPSTHQIKLMPPSNLEILAYEDSPLGPLCLRRRELLAAPGTVVTEVTLNHAFLMSSYNTASERALADVAVGMYSGSDLRVLVGGLGLGYTAHAALASPRVASVEVVEFLPQVIEWLEQDLVPLSGALKADERLTLLSGDIYARLAAQPNERFDLILIDVDHAPDDQLSGTNDLFYTREGLLQARQHLAPGGILGVWSYAESSPFAAALAQVFDEVCVEPVPFFNELIYEETTDWLFFAR